jgi:hypothetical protein
VDVQAATASLKQKGQILVSHYVNVVEKHLKKILTVTRYLAVDGFL